MVKLLEDENTLVQAHTARCIGAACHNDVVAKNAGEYLGLISSLVRLLWNPNGQVRLVCLFFALLLFCSFALLLFQTVFVPL